jgi:hypothetical protein
VGRPKLATLSGDRRMEIWNGARCMGIETR